MQELNGSDNDLQTMYLTTKMLFAHAQAYISTSTSLIQASLLIATYEYGHGLIEAAYISIGTCARMGYAAGFHKGQFGRSSLRCQSWPTLKDEEEHNLWWGIIICERYGLVKNLDSLHCLPYAIIKGSQIHNFRKIRCRSALRGTIPRWERGPASRL